MQDKDLWKIFQESLRLNKVTFKYAAIFWSSHYIVHCGVVGRTTYMWNTVVNAAELFSKVIFKRIFFYCLLCVRMTLLSTRMKFLDINLTKEWSLLLHAMYYPVPSTGQCYRKPYSTLVLKIIKKSAKQENSSLYINCIL
jgi:hypothetical protein